MEHFAFLIHFFPLNAQLSSIRNLSIIRDKYHPDPSFPVPFIKLQELLLL